MITTLNPARKLILVMIVGLLLSGLTVFPIPSELASLIQWIPDNLSIQSWLTRILGDFQKTNSEAPELIYGYDWLGFAHIILAILFIGAYKDPVRNIWIIQFGLISCVLVIPFAFIAGHFRGIPWLWTVIDCSFGVVGFLVLWYAYAAICSFINHNKI
jgi:hypothetical protein